MTVLKDFFGIKRIDRYGTVINSYDIAKFIAIFFMIVDHFGYYFYTDTYILRGLGRAAFPIFFFLIGYSYKERQDWNLLILGTFITAYKAFMTGEIDSCDILVTAYISKLILKFFLKKDMVLGSQVFMSYLVLIFWHVLLVILTSYGSLGALFAICGYLKRKENEGQSQRYFMPMLLLTIISDYFLQRVFWSYSENIVYSFSTVSICLLYYLSNFRMADFSYIKNKVLVKTVLLVSRNSLLIYVVHLIAFITISVIYFPELYSN